MYGIKIKIKKNLLLSATDQLVVHEVATLLCIKKNNNNKSMLAASSTTYQLEAPLNKLTPASTNNYEYYKMYT